MSAHPQFTTLALVTLLLSGRPEILHGSDKHSKSNEEIMVDLSREAVDSLCVDLNIPDTTAVGLHIEVGDVNRFFTQPLVESFHQHFVSLYTRSTASNAEILASIAKVGVLYGEPFTDGFFSARRCARSLDVEVRFTATRSSDGKVLWAGTKKNSFSDTVYVDDIPKLQESSMRVASGTMPDRSALERFIEPLIIAGAAGIAVYLFFTIRS